MSHRAHNDVITYVGEKNRIAALELDARGDIFERFVSQGQSIARALERGFTRNFCYLTSDEWRSRRSVEHESKCDLAILENMKKAELSSPPPTDGFHMADEGKTLVIDNDNLNGVVPENFPEITTLVFVGYIGPRLVLRWDDFLSLTTVVADGTPALFPASKTFKRYKRLLSAETTALVKSLR